MADFCWCVPAFDVRDWLLCWLVDWVIGWLVGWLVEAVTVLGCIGYILQKLSRSTSGHVTVDCARGRAEQ